MSGSLFGIYLTVPNLDPMIAQLEKTGHTLPNLTKAVSDSTLVIQQIWQAYALGTTVTYSGGTFVIQPGTGEYAKSIQRQFPYRGFLSGVVFSTAKIADLIEKGYGPFDMKCIVDARAKVLTSQGWKNIKDVAVGDLVLTHKGQFRTVTATSRDRLNSTDRTLCINVKVGKRTKRIHVTDNHPFLVGNDWIKARDLDPANHKLRMLAYPCANEKCTNLSPFFRETCSTHCARVVSNLHAARNGNHPMHREKNRKSQSERIKRLNRKMLKEGIHVSQRKDIKDMWAERISRGEHPFQKEWAERPDELMRAAHRGLGAKHHGKTTLEERMDGLLREMMFTTSWAGDRSPGQFIRQYKVVRDAMKPCLGGFRNRWYFLDFADPINKIAIECNGERWHSPEKDAPRLAELHALGWTVLSFYSKQVFGEPDSVKAEIAAIYGNHSGNYGFVDSSFTIEETDVSAWGCKYDIEVEEDASFICHGVVVHNSGLLRSSKAKLTKPDKNGKQTRYITIPFRHNVPGAGATGASMPQNIYNQASQMDFSRITGRTPWGNFTYAWGGRLPANLQGQKTKPQIGGMTGAYTWKTGPYSGMVRMLDSATGKSGGYLTFRRVSEKSDPNSWWHPGVKPRPVTQAVIEKAEPSVLRMLRTGAALDLAMAGVPVPKDLR